MKQIRARMLGIKCYGPNYKLKDLDTGETIEAHVHKRADIKLLLSLMAYRIFKVVIIDAGEILSADPDRTTNRFFETKTGASVIYKQKIIAPKTINKKAAKKRRKH
jgi:hypothetical protein